MRSFQQWHEMTTTWRKEVLEDYWNGTKPMGIERIERISSLASVASVIGPHKIDE